MSLLHDETQNDFSGGGRPVGRTHTQTTRSTPARAGNRCKRTRSHAQTHSNTHECTHTHHERRNVCTHTQTQFSENATPPSPCYLHICTPEREDSHTSSRVFGMLYSIVYTTRSSFTSFQCVESEFHSCTPVPYTLAHIFQQQHTQKNARTLHTGAAAGVGGGGGGLAGGYLSSSTKPNTTQPSSNCLTVIQSITRHTINRNVLYELY